MHVQIAGKMSSFSVANILDKPSGAPRLEDEIKFAPEKKQLGEWTMACSKVSLGSGVLRAVHDLRPLSCFTCAGKGAFGVVHLGTHKYTGEQVAVKSISKAKLVCKEDVKDVQAEVAIMNLVAGHANVVTLQVIIMPDRLCLMQAGLRSMHGDRFRPYALPSSQK